MGKLVWSMWGRYMAIAAALCMIDGGLWSLLFNWPTAKALKSPLDYLYWPVSIPGAVGVVMGLVTLLIERAVLSCPLGFRAMLYLATAGFCGLQFSCVIGAEFYLITAFVYLRALVAGESPRDGVGRRRHWEKGQP